LFSFLKSKEVLKDFISEGYVDIHSHLLPGIDDGSKTIADTEFLIKGMAEIGISKFITTPHVMNSVYPNTSIIITDLLQKTSEELANNDCNATIKAAAEYFMDDFFLAKLQGEKLLTLKENYVLVEMSYMNPPINLFDIIFEIQIAGYIPVLAHPERYFYYHKSFEDYLKIKKSGCLFQLNLLSTVGYYGADVAKTADILLKKGLVDFVGSDVHHKNHLNSFNSKLVIKQTASLKEAVLKNQFFSF
jgi:protein-tyrosine phosphatase